MTRRGWIVLGTTAGLVLLLVLVAGLLVFTDLPVPVIGQYTSATASAPAARTQENNLMEITLVEQSFDGFTSVRPRGWRAEEGGAYAYADTDIAIVQRQIGAPGVSWVQPGIERQMNFVSHAGWVDTVTHNGLEWRVYRGQTDRFTVDYALANGSLMTVYMVLMQVPPGDYDTLHDLLFLPALQQFQPE